MGVQGREEEHVSTRKAMDRFPERPQPRLMAGMGFKLSGL